MASKYIALAEQTQSWILHGDAVNNSPVTNPIYLKLLTESINTTREDFYPETTQYWVPGKRAEGFFRTAGSFDTLVDPRQWTKVLCLFTGDPGSTGPADSAYTHIFKFGANEVYNVNSTGVKPFTTLIGVGILKDREIIGSVIDSLSIECVNKEVVTSTIGILGSGWERLVSAYTPTYATQYAQPYLTFQQASVVTVGVSDRLTVAPAIEAFRMTCNRGWDADQYLLGSRFLGGNVGPMQSGMCSVEGTMDFSFTSQAEHERFLGAINATESGNQVSFPIQIVLTGPNHIGAGSTHYSLTIDIPEAQYRASTVNVSGRDRIVQSVDWMGMYNVADTCAAKFTVVNDFLATGYSSLA